MTRGQKLKQLVQSAQKPNQRQVETDKNSGRVQQAAGQKLVRLSHWQRGGFSEPLITDDRLSQSP